MPGEVFTPIEMLRGLVAFDTTYRDSNLALIDFVADYLEGHGIAEGRADGAIHVQNDDRIRTISRHTSPLRAFSTSNFKLRYYRTFTGAAPPAEA